MNRMTWKQLKNYIDKHPEFLDHVAMVYDFNDGQEYEIGVTELLTESWIPYITINTKEENPALLR